MSAYNWSLCILQQLAKLIMQISAYARSVLSGLMELELQTTARYAWSSTLTEPDSTDCHQEKHCAAAMQTHEPAATAGGKTAGATRGDLSSARYFIKIALRVWVKTVSDDSDSATIFTK